MLAERRDLTVATYSSALGTGSRLIVCVFTGMGCGAGCFASVRLHPEFANIANRTSTDCAMTARFFTVSPRLTSMNKMMLADARKVHDFLECPDIRKIDTKLLRQNQLAHGVRLKTVDIESFRDQSVGAVNN